MSLLWLSCANIFRVRGLPKLPSKLKFLQALFSLLQKQIMLHLHPSAPLQLDLLSDPVASATSPLLTISPPSTWGILLTGLLIIQIIHDFFITQCYACLCLTCGYLICCQLNPPQSAYPWCLSFLGDGPHKYFIHVVSTVTASNELHAMFSTHQSTNQSSLTCRSLPVPLPVLPTCWHAEDFLCGSAEIKIVWIGLYSTVRDLQN